MEQKRRNLTFLGTGVWNTAHEVEGGLLHGKVIKRLEDVELEPSEYRELASAHKIYARSLADLGISIMGANMSHVSRGEGRQPMFIQNKGEKQRLFSEVIWKGSENEALTAFRQLAKVLVSAAKKREKADRKPFVDGNPENYLAHGPSILLLDHFPPIYVEGREFYPHIMAKIGDQKELKIIKNPSLNSSYSTSTPDQLRKELYLALKGMFGAHYPLAQLLNYSLSVKPALKQKFIGIMRQEYRAAFGRIRGSIQTASAIAQVEKWMKN